MSAHELARKIPAGGRVDWNQIEWAAFQGTSALDGKSRRGSKPQLWVLIPLVIVVAFFALTPIMGFVILSEGGRFATAARDSDPSKTIPWAGVFFACAAVALVVLVIAWIVTKKPMAARGFGLYTAIFAIIALFGIYRRGREHSVENYELWSIPVWVAAVLGSILAVLYVIAGIQRLLKQDGRRSPRSGRSEERDRAQLEQRRQRITALTPEQRRAVREDLDAAVHELASRKLISPEQEERALSAELGALAFEMNATARSRS